MTTKTNSKQTDVGFAIDKYREQSYNSGKVT
jgi:hypothetical protein